MTTIFNDIPVPTLVRRGGRPVTEPDFAKLSPGQCVFVTIGEGETGEKVRDRVKGQIARWRKAQEGRKTVTFVVAEQPIPNDPLGTVGVGIWRTA